MTIDSGLFESQEQKRFCKIIHIPDKPPVPAHLQPTVKVHAAQINPKHANTLIRKLNQVAPLENLRHVKRIRKNKPLDGGECQLSVILCKASEDGNQFDKMPNDVMELINSFQLSTFVMNVPKYAATTKEEWEEQCKWWPTSYHPPTYNIDGIAGFSEESSQTILGFMKKAIVLAKSCEDQMVNAAVIVDPSTNEVIASACDQVSPLADHFCKSNTEVSYSRYSDEMIHLNASEMEQKCMLTAKCSSSELIHFPHSVGCLHPWSWAEKHILASSGSWHPLLHAVIVAIEYAAARDRQLFPTNGYNEENFNQFDHILSSPVGSPLKKAKLSLAKVHDEENLGSERMDTHPESARPYLCTGCDIYLVWEPCTMCAMALVHQRVKRIFYAFPNPYAGALGSVHRLQGEKSLNHHYAAFRVIIPEEALGNAALATEAADTP